MAQINALTTRDGDERYPVTVADAVIVKDGDTNKTLTTKLTEMTTSFQDGVDTLVATLKELGVTPGSTTPAGIAAAIKTIYTDRYNAGVSKGHADVIADPGAYGLITQSAYNAYGTKRYNEGVAYADGRVNTSSASYKSGYSDGNTAGYNTGVSKINGKSTGEFRFFLYGWTEYGGMQSAQETVNYVASYSNGVITLVDQNDAASTITITL